MLRFSPNRAAASIVLNANVRGPQGSAATVAIGTTATRQAGLPATVSNSGTPAAAIFNYGIPRGADSGLCFNFEASTSMGAPAAGGVRLNNATLSSVTAIAINASDVGAIDVSDFVATWDDSTNAVKGYLEVRKEASGAVEGLFQITSVTDNTTWLQFAVTYVSGSGSFAVDDHVYLTPYRTGNKGANAGVGFLFASSTSMADPSAGNFRLNNASFASVTAAAVSANSGDSGNPSVLAWLQAFDDSTTTAHRGYVFFRKETAPENFAIFDITGALTDNTTWVQLALTYKSGNGSFSASDPVTVSFIRTGDAGDFSTNTGVSVDGEAVVFNGTSGKSGRRFTLTGLMKAVSGVFAAATAGTDFMKPDTTSALTAGFTSASVNSGTKTTGTYTFDPTVGGVQDIVRGGAFTLAMPATKGSWRLDVLNNASAGNVTLSGVTQHDGDIGWITDNTNTRGWTLYISGGSLGYHVNAKRMV